MDTKLKNNNHKLEKIIILLTVLIPSIVLVALYPQMGKVYDRELNQFNQMISEEQNKIENSQEDAYHIDVSCVNYLIESSYYLYGQMLQEETGEPVDFRVLDEYGWINDHYTVKEETTFYAELLKDGVSVQHKTNSDHIENELNMVNTNMTDEYIGCMNIAYDQYGNLSEVHYQSFYDNDYNDINEHLYAHAKESFQQYQTNVNYYNSYATEQVDEKELHPKDFKAIYLIKKNSTFSYIDYIDYGSYAYLSPVDSYYNMGAIFFVFLLAVLVAFVALLLPFFKKVDAGSGRLSNLSFEVSALIGGLDLCFAYFMFMLMTMTNMRYINDNMPADKTIHIVGLSFHAEQIYIGLMIVGFLGWIIAFATEYFCIASMRKLLQSPKSYMKNKVLCIRFIRWCGSIGKKFFSYVLTIDMNHKAHGFILKFVVVQVIIMAACCALWFVGWFGVLAYGVILYFAMRKAMKRICDQYQTILDATHRMAEGDLRFETYDNLVEFKELGEELQLVQEGFSKAVMEEAKSQNMKTELITNVSHDLKTPLTAIITYIDLLKRENITEEERCEYIQTLEKKSQRLKILIEDLFEVSKATTNNITMNYADVDIVNLIKQVRLENEDKIADSDLEFHWNMPQEKWILSLDPNRTYRVIDNLIQNVLKYAMPKSRVYVDLNAGEEYVVFQIKNMSAAAMNFDAKEITERFVRGDLSRNTEGSGLGLAIARSFTELQNGVFDIEIDGDLFKVIVKFKR